MNIRRARPEDVTGKPGCLIRLLDQFAPDWAVEYDVDAKRRELRNLMADGNIFLVAEQDGQIVGTLTLCLDKHLRSDSCTAARIEDVIVDAGQRGLGIGAAIVREAVEIARHMGCYKIILSCADHNVAFYEKCGFRRHEIGMRFDA